ncbi:hypothetical protein [Alicyclobacillus fodiniaquatilis]|uniref:Uncharacterized protein n=1 Tax=Alicyclobacillus fodiniaquatilis TaxID=1661150 RepID=A0ABW4JNU8_9BACL
MMISEEGASRYLEEAAIQDLLKKYQSEGYEVINPPSLMANIQPDLVFEKNGKKLIIEVVVRGGREREQTDKILQIHKALQGVQPAEFKTVFVTPPKRSTVEIDGIERILKSELENGAYQIEIGNGVRFNEVSDVEIDNLTITGEAIHISGSFVVSVEIQFGPSRDGIEVDESFPGTFKAELQHDLTPMNVDIQIDSSSWQDELSDE